MNIAFFDSTAVVEAGPGSPAYFSRFLIRRLREAGHQIFITTEFDEDLCRAADLVVCEWANEDAYRAAASGACRRLVVRMRGFDAHGPLDKLTWRNVDLLVYESAMLKSYVEGRFPELSAVHQHCVLASGIDVRGAPFVRREWPRQPDRPIVALVARATNDKGYQLAFEWARQQSHIDLHVTTALPQTSPRLIEYLKHTAPRNVEIHGTVDTMPWLNEIGATHVLSASIWETLGYTMVEGMAVGCRPLIHDVPGARHNWSSEFLWKSLHDLTVKSDEAFDSNEMRDYALANFDERTLSQSLIARMLALPAREVVSVRDSGYAFRDHVLSVVKIAREDLQADAEQAARAAEEFRARWPVNDRYTEDRYAVACGMVGVFLVREDLERAAQWACRALLDAPWPDAMCLMGEIAAQRGDIENAVAWYDGAIAVQDPFRRCRIQTLVDNMHERRQELSNVLYKQPGGGEHPMIEARPPMAVVVTVRNAEKWIARCLNSIAIQRHPFLCVVIDDVSTDGTASEITNWLRRSGDARFIAVENTERKYQARNTVEGARLVAKNPEDIVVLIDGDDWLAHESAFNAIAGQYAYGAWMTYGNYVTSSGERSKHGAYPLRIAGEGDHANWTWQATAPRTFKRFLLDELRDEDFLLDGQWPKVAGDVCVLLPMLQMARERAVGVDEPIYVYNDETPDNDHKQNAGEQVRVRDRLMDRPVKSRLER